MAREEPKPFHMKDLFIDVKLEACANGTTFDFLGRKLFSTEFFRKDIGFGIINIDIEVNTSLQPIVAITFKDLYGQTIFGGQTRDSGIDKQSIDYSVLFDWPPPKFLFSFKGYLGNPVSWMLNLKRTSTSFNSSDGSYEVKCEFVPNQWGFFADIPMLFLLAAKALRRDALGSRPTIEQQKSITSVFDLVKIGKQVEIKTQDTTKEFDELIKQLGSLKSNITNTLYNSKIISFGDDIDGVVNNIPISGTNGKKFLKIKIPTVSELGYTEQKISLILGDPTKVNKFNTFLLTRLKFNGKDNAVAGYPEINLTDDNVVKAKNIAIESINQNLRLIEDEIKRRVFSTSEKKLEKITIGEIFSQLAKDAAFIIGSILDVGIKGQRNSNRDSFDNRLIGQAFPLVIKSDGEEVPATKDNLGSNIGVEENEMDFVRKFINAISEGIARDLVQDDASSLSEDSTLKSRISNIEMVKGNPYKPFYQDIATNILVRGGIVGCVTRSNDPNRPGDYGNTTSLDNDSVTDIIEIANREIENITDGILSELSETDVLLLKRFCRFFYKFYDESGQFELDKDGKPTSQIITIASASKPIEMEEGGQTLMFKNLFKSLTKPMIGDHFEGMEEIPYFYEDLETSGQISIVSDEHPLSFVNTENYTAKKIINNGIAYTAPSTNAADNRYWYVVFEGEDNQKAQQVNSSPTDAEYKDEDKDDPANMFFTAEKPLGYIPIDALYVQEESGAISTTKLGRVTTLEKRVSTFEVVDYSKLKNPLNSFYDVTNSSGFQSYLWNKEIFSSREEALLAGKDLSEVAIIGEFGYTVFSNFDIGFADEGNVFDFFMNAEVNIKGRNQRIFVRRVCKLILDKLAKIEDERNQVVGSVLGKAGEQEGALYKQMHTLFHQWQALAHDGYGECGINVEADANIAEKLEKKYSSGINGKSQHISITSAEDVNSIPDGAFIYEFPLQRITGVPQGQKPIQVRDSIINIESLYKINGETSVLNIIQQICTKNNFLFVPIPGNASYLNVSDIYNPSPLHAEIDLRNFFHVLFTPTPESRSKNKNGGTELALSENHKSYSTNSFVIKYGHPDNQIVSNIQVGTDDNKVTAESIVNLQRLVDNENQNKTVTTDCSTLPVLEGRSYNASIDMLGNAQVYPMQFFFLENSPLFGGLYQVMKVKHSITPNDMKTSVDGMRMRFTPGDGYGSIKPVTLDTFKDLGRAADRIPFTKDEVSELKSEGITADIIESINYSGQTSVPGNNGGLVAMSIPMLSSQLLNSLPHTNIDLYKNSRTPTATVTGYVYAGKVYTSQTLSAYKALFEAASADGVTIFASSAYRNPYDNIIVNGKSVATSQYSLRKSNVIDKSKKDDENYLMTASSSKFRPATAKPGSSAHSAGIAVDFNTGSNASTSPSNFKPLKPKQYAWMVANAYKFGFIRTVASEEWHWEYHPGQPMFSKVPRNNPLWYDYVEKLKLP